MARHQPGDSGPAVRITTASEGRTADIATRQRRYLLAMGFRTLCFVAAIVVPITWLRVGLIVAALVLPYVAVVMANAATTKSGEFALLEGPTGLRELPSASESRRDAPGHDL